MNLTQHLVSTPGSADRTLSLPKHCVGDSLLKQHDLILAASNCMLKLSDELAPAMYQRPLGARGFSMRTCEFSFKADVALYVSQPFHISCFAT